MLLRRLRAPPLLRAQRCNFSTSSNAVLATSLRDIARNGARVVELQLPKSGDLVCRQLMCEHVGDACACRLALMLERVPRLQHLDLSNNQLRALPDAVFALQELETLKLGRNRLVELPTGVQKLTKLQTLDMSHNRLVSLPAEQLETLTQLKTLRVAGNNDLVQRLEAMSMSEQLRAKLVLQ